MGRKAKPTRLTEIWPKGLGQIDPDWIPKYPCQTCHTPFQTRTGLATHFCDPRGTREKPKKPSKPPANRSFTDEQIEAIRLEYCETSVTAKELAERYGVTPRTIYNVTAGLRVRRPNSKRWH
ncbi:HTH domain-containing protein [Streptomyces sp. NPDC005385]|uniref:HTH domain-containing protein n=1 Tax=Streptomyces sp. NPDC005385 TaxID=3157039 RepID=UPI0033BF72BE